MFDGPSTSRPPPPAGEQPPRVAGERRLALAIAVSLAVHLAILGSLARRPPPVSARQPPPLQVRLATALPVAPMPPPATLPPTGDAEAIPPPRVVDPAAPDETRPPGKPPRFAAAPDFSDLESMPIVGPLRLKLRIHVAAVGRATRVDVLETRLVPAAFLAGVVTRLEQARYEPGRSGSEAVDGDFELVIEAAPQFEPGEPGAMPRQ